MRVALHAVGSGDALAGDVGQQLRAARRDAGAGAGVLAAVADYVSGLVRANDGMQGVSVEIAITVVPAPTEPPPAADCVAAVEDEMAAERRKRPRVHMAR